MAQGFEIDFLPVGNGDKSGDAIAIRYGMPGDYKVVVYDGGTRESGQKLVDHIKRHYGTSRVDYVINSHPDQDHASGLAVVLEQLEVGELWMHRPWAYSSLICDYFHDGRITEASLAERMKEKMGAAYSLEELAHERGIPVYEPFQGKKIGCFTVLSPEKNWYIHGLVPDFAKTPKRKAALESLTLASLLSKASDAVMQWIDETWHYETLREDVSTSAENESSVILYGCFGETLQQDGVLITGDAGVRALAAAADYVDSCGHSLPSIVDFWQVPHHGSRNNVSSTVLDRIVGPRLQTELAAKKHAFVSASKESSKHPRKVVVNAFARRGVHVYATQGQSKRHARRMPARSGWVSATKLEFSPKVEPWD